MALSLTFRPLTDEDLPMMHGWLNEPGVVRWWEGDDVSWEAIVNDYGSDGDHEGYEHWIACNNGQPVAWIQCGAVADFDTSDATPWLVAGVQATAAGIDYLIGEPTARGKGLGATMINDFVIEVVFGRHPHWTQVAADPYEANIGSWRALEKAGFEFLAALDDDDEADGPTRLMVRSRSDS